MSNLDSTADAIPLVHLAVSFVPVAMVLALLYRWTDEGNPAVYGFGRMIVQLLAVGYVLTFIFGSNQPAVVVATLTAMLAIASWIALRPLSARRTTAYPQVLLSITLGGVSTLLLVTQGVLMVDRWHEASVIIPLAGMVFAMSMNTVSLAAERYHAETSRAVIHHEARRIALRSALIPRINNLYALGLVSFPGMMTGQILAGVAPLVAVRYQIMITSMMFSAGGMSAACYLWLQARRNGDRTDEPDVSQATS